MSFQTQSPTQTNLNLKFLLEEIKILIQENSRLARDNKELVTRILELEEKLKTNSSNSSKPPSQDPFRSTKNTKSSERKPGGQPGHPRHIREMVPQGQVNRIVEVKPESCPRCGADMSGADSISVKHRQVVELSAVFPDVTQYNIQTCKCHICGKQVKAEIPQEAKKSFGPRLMAFLTMLCGEAGVTKRKICAIMNHLGIKISLGGVCNIHRLAGDLLREPFEEIRTVVLQSSNVNADETSWRYQHERCWLWIGATPMATFFCINPSRSKAAFQNIFSGFCNTLTTDRYGAYNHHLGIKQACLAHILRDFIKVSERPDADGAIGRILCDQLNDIFALWKQFKAGTLLRLELQVQANEIIENTKIVLKSGTIMDCLNPKTEALCYDLLNRFDTLWTFLYQENVEPTNNLAERGLRPAVIYRKLSGGSRSKWGMIFTERLLTVVCTFRQRAKNVFTFLTGTFRAHAFGGPAPPVFTS
ncbi:MAG: IS66 family transposase [Alphaproteobacteria bacterium]|nr:IS66 family transposase [Alphaproteobacteria bacterium]